MDAFLRIIGLPASLGIIFSAIFSFFLLLERVASPEKTRAFSVFLRSTDWETWPQRFPSIIRASFESVFDHRHLSIRCFSRSILFSLSTITILLVLGFVNHFGYFWTLPYMLFDPAAIGRTPGYPIIFFGWLSWSICLDYFNLFKSRLVLRLFDAARAYKSIFVIFALAVFLDIGLSIFIFVLSYQFLDAQSMSYQVCLDRCSVFQTIDFGLSIFRTIALQKQIWAHTIALIMGGPVSNEVAIFFWAGLLPTTWLVIYIIATIITRSIVTLANPIRVTVSWLDTDRPFQAVGFVSAMLVSLWVGIASLINKFFA